MNIVITMAGLGSRFQKAGYKQPKFEIAVKGKTLFEWSMESLIDLNSQPNTKYIFVVRKECQASDFIMKNMKKLGALDIQVIEIDKLTDGQATTAMLAKDIWRKDDELVVYNIDTYVEPGSIRYNDFTGDGFIPCFKAAGDHWSFVKLDEAGNVIEIREKQRISENCTIGLYYFRTARLYEKIYDDYYQKQNNLESGEKYIAPLYNYMIRKGMIVKIIDLPVEKVHVLGTPEEVETFSRLNTI